MGLSIGPKVPLGDFAKKHNLGIGFDVTFSYTDNFYIPAFFYTKLGYQHFPGSQSYYKKSDHSAISTNSFMINSGIRVYLPPIMENIAILMPFVELGATYAFQSVYHQYRIDVNKVNSTEENSKFGVHFGGGVSMFLLDVVGYYTYLHNSQFLSMDVRIRIPIYLKM